MSLQSQGAKAVSQLCGSKSGLTLVEMLVSLFLGSMLISVVWSVYLMMTNAYSSQNRLREVINQTTSISYLLNEAVEQAGYIGCAKLTDRFPIHSSSQISLTLNNRIMGTSTSIIVRRASRQSAMLLSQGVDKDELIADLGMRFHPDDVILISDCTHADIVKIKHIKIIGDEQLIELNAPVFFNYAKGAEMGLFEINEYVISVNKPYQLTLKTLDGHVSTLADYIEKIHIRYLINNKLTEANSVTDWSLVKGVEFEWVYQMKQSLKPWTVYVSIAS